jgi:PAS domain S-box-containing protein
MPSDPRHPHVLVVDDDGDTRELYTIMLGSVGYRVETVGSVRAAAASAGREVPHVVMTDWRLPDGDGFAVADAMHAHTASRGVPIVAVTGVAMGPQMEAEARSRGFTSILLKPAAPDRILSSVRQAGEIATTRQVRAAAERLRRYLAHASRHSAELRAAKSAIDATSALLARAAARSGEHITLTLADDAARYVAAAGGARELTGYEPQELLSLSVWDLTPPQEASTSEGCWRSFLASGTKEGRYTLRRRDGAAVEAQYCQIANVVPGLHVSAIAQAIQVPSSF